MMQLARYLNTMGGKPGRENGREAIDAYLQTKTAWIDTAGAASNPFVIR